MTAADASPGACAETGNRDLAAAYVSGRLDEDAADAFEAHYFECDACWARVQRALEVRAAFREVEGAPANGAADDEATGGGPGVGGPDRGPEDAHPFRPARWWLPAAAAALLAGIAFGVGDFLREPSPEADGPVYRGEAGTMDLYRAELGDGAVEAAWAAVPDADVYRVRLYDADGRLLAEGESTDTAVVLARPAAADASPAGSLYLQVEALDELRQVIGRSSGIEIGGPDPTSSPPSPWP